MNSLDYTSSFLEGKLLESYLKYTYLINIIIPWL